MKNILTKALVVGAILIMGTVSYSSNNEGGNHEGKLNREEQLLMERKEKEITNEKKEAWKCKVLMEQEKKREEAIKEMDMDYNRGPYNNN